MSRNRDWVKEVTPEIYNSMQASIEAAYNNACSLLDDSELLLKNKRYSRATALAILAEEEFSKSYILLSCLGQSRWDSNIYKSLKTHSTKQGVSEAARNHFNWSNENIRKTEELNKTSEVKHEPMLFPDEHKIKELKELANSRFKKPINDHVKQNSFYVSLDKNARIMSTPAIITELNAKQYIAEAKEFKSITETLIRMNLQ